LQKFELSQKEKFFLITTIIQLLQQKGVELTVSAILVSSYGKNDQEKQHLFHGRVKPEMIDSVKGALSLDWFRP
jgi:hypothetical protein